MTKAKRLEGPSAPLFYCALPLLFGAAAIAQTVEVSELERCAALETDVLKLACYESLASTDSDAPPTEPPAAAELEPATPEPAPPANEIEVSPEAATVEVVETPPEAPSEPFAVAPVPAADPEPGREPEPATVQQREPVPAAAPQPEPAPTSDAAAVPESYGLNGRSGPEVVTASVVKVTKDRYGALIFHFANGQVWKQLEKRYFSYPKRREFDVTISRGMMGEYRLQVEGAGRKVTIRRTQ